MTQELALHLMKSGRNVFLTGAPGTGKTHVLKQYISYLREHSIPFAVTAPTGIAASHIGGTTIHSYFGIGLKDSLTQYDIEALTEKKYLWDRMAKLKVLIIDEVSMLSPSLFRSIDALLRTFKFSMEPFGGVQLVLVGDFFQLPPIQKNREGEKFIFQTEVWNQSNLAVCSLEHSYRHEGDKLFHILSSIRNGVFGEKEQMLLRERMRPLEEEGEIGTRLYTHNIDVDRINEEMLTKLMTPPQLYEASGKGTKRWREKIFQTSLLSEKLFLKKDALVLFIKNNFEKGYSNGTLGKVVDFEEGFPVVKTREGREIIVRTETWEHRDSEGKVLATVNQIPLRLAWAITVHKSQGMTLDAAEIDLRKTFAPGQGYVALSRLRSLSGLYLRGVNRMAFAVDEDAREYERRIVEESKQYHASFIQLDDKEKEEMYRTFREQVAKKKRV